MLIKQKLKQLRDGYVINQVQSINFPYFEADIIRRYRITFEGRVQKVGFRLEVYELAQRLNLTGLCKNLTNGKVLVELQGPENKINFLISFMENLRRIKIVHKKIEELEVDNEESEFTKITEE